MNLTSCPNCGIVYDKDNIKWPERSECFTEDGSYSDKTTKYEDGEFYKKVPCKVCGADIVDYSETLWG